MDRRSELQLFDYVAPRKAEWVRETRFKSTGYIDDKYLDSTEFYFNAELTSFAEVNSSSLYLSRV